MEYFIVVKVDEADIRKILKENATPEILKKMEYLMKTTDQTHFVYAGKEIPLTVVAVFDRATGFNLEEDSLPTQTIKFETIVVYGEKKDEDDGGVVC